MMKKSDVYMLVFFLALFLPFILIKPAYDFYSDVNKSFPYLMSFIKFAILATIGEMIGLRIRTGKYHYAGFGLIPRAVVWGFLGMTIKLAFVIFGAAAPTVLNSLGIDTPADILKTPGFSMLKLLTAFTVSVTMNLFFAPVFMTFHKITDMHIEMNKGTSKTFITPIPFGYIFPKLNWFVQWDFVFKRTIILFWIPAQTINFLLPEEVRILVAALYSIILGVLLAIASLKSKSNK